MGPGQHLDPFGQGDVSGDLSVVVRVGADQVGQHLGVAGVGLASTDVMAVTVPGRGHRVDRVHLVPRGDQGAHPQSPVGLDPDQDLPRILGVRADQGVETPDPFDASRSRRAASRRPLSSMMCHVVMFFGPAIADVDHDLTCSFVPSSWVR